MADIWPWPHSSPIPPPMVTREMLQQPRSTSFSAAILFIVPCEIAVHPLVFLLFITSFSLPGNVATQLPSFVCRITEVRNLSVPSGL
jgi:hypothetical protein